MTPRMHLGVALDFGLDAGGRSVAEQLRAAEPVLADAAEAGFTSVWLGESYHDRPEPFHLPAPLMLLARLAPVTNLRLGTGVLLARAYDADRLALEAALLDQLSEGRLLLGVGLGPEPLRGRLGGADRPGGRLLDALLTRLRERWSDPNGLRPGPHSAAGPPVYVGGRGPAAAHRAATLADGYYAATNYSDRVLADQALRYRQEAGDRPRVAVNRICVVDSDGDRAHRHAEEHFGRIHHYYRSRSAWDIGRSAGDPDPVLVGTPDQVAERLRRYAELGVTQVQLRIAPAGAPASLARRTIAEIGEHLVPQMREQDTTPT